MTRPHPRLGEAHDLGPHQPASRWWRLRDRWRRILHPHGLILDRLQRLQALECPACSWWRTDPSLHCPRCGQ